MNTTLKVNDTSKKSFFEKRLGGRFSPDGRNFECTAKNSGYFLGIHSKIIVSKIMSFSDAEKGDMASPDPRWVCSSQGMNLYLNHEFLFPRGCM